MKKLLAGLMLMCSLNAQDFLKFGTIYGAYNLTSPLTKNQTYQVSNGQLQELQEELEDHGSLTFGIRKLARFDYENKPEVWYTGKEAPINESVMVGNGMAKGWEYVLEYSKHTQFGESFDNHEYMLRYLAPKFIFKSNYDAMGLEDLEFAAVDMRYRINKGNWDFSAGLAARSHPAYLDFRPIDLYWEELGIDPDGVIPFWLLAWDEAGYADGPYKDEWKQHYTQFGWEYWDWCWTDAEGNVVAITDEEFYRNIYGDIVEDYNESYARGLGYQHELALSLGADYYKYTDHNWFHLWVTAYPYNKGMSDYSFNYNSAKYGMDYDAGLVLGWKLSNKFGVFVQTRYINMYDIQSYEAQTGFNWLIY